MRMLHLTVLQTFKMSRFNALRTVLLGFLKHYRNITFYHFEKVTKTLFLNGFLNIQNVQFFNLLRTFLLVYMNVRLMFPSIILKTL